MTTRTKNYRCTIKSLNSKLLKSVRKEVAELNSKPKAKYKYSVRVRGRLGKNNPNAELYGADGPLSYARDVRMEHASRFDVYVRKTAA